MDGKPSTNHIYFSDGGESVLCDRAILKTLKDRVYLIRTIDGKEGYLELFDPMQERGGDTRSTLDIDPRMVEFRATAIDAKEKALEGLGVANETKVIVQKNSEAIGELDAKPRPSRLSPTHPTAQRHPCPRPSPRSPSAT